MKTSDFDYNLPLEQIAQHPVEPRDSSRLLVLDRATGERTHTTFAHIVDYLQPNDVLVINRSRVVPARLFGRKLPGGGKVELLLLERLDAATWKALVGGKGLHPGRQVELANGVLATIAEDLQGAQRIVTFDQPMDNKLEGMGQVPLPPYIHEALQDPERYQTVYAQQPGSAAAPTAGLHFTPELMARIEAKGIPFVEVLLHIGLDTFAPVNEEDPAQHHIHTEWCQLPDESAAAINAARQRGGRVIAVGTTSVRTLESAARNAVNGNLVGYEGRTDLFIMPGFQFQVVDAIITNFHLPRSTLVMLVSAFAGRESILASYREAIDRGYRFFSFGDAMFIE